MGEARRYTVHLSGPLSGCNERQRRLWRDDFKRSCRGVETIDPSEWGDEWDFSRDLSAVSACDVLVANMWKESIGTTLEIMHARSRGKPVVLIDPNHLEHTILRGLVAPEKPVATVREAAARVLDITKELDRFNVQKRDGTLERFDREKLARAIRLACAEAGVDDLEFPNQLIGPVVATLRKLDADGTLVTTERIRATVTGEMDRLQTKSSAPKAVAEIAARVREAWHRREQYKRGDLLFQELRSERDALRHQIDDLNGHIEALQAELTIRDSRLAALERRIGAEAAAAPTTLVEALSRVERDFAGAIMVHPRAVKSAKESPFQDVEKASTALRLLGRYAAERLEAATLPGGHPPAAREWFKEHQEEAPWLDYASHESVTSKGKWGGERTVEHDGESLLAEQHLKIGAGGAETTLRIHFAVHKAEGYVVVAHCGRHLTNTKS